MEEREIKKANETHLFKNERMMRVHEPGKLINIGSYELKVSYE